MSVASLNRFTVPLANDQSATSQGLLMPKLQYRFRVMLEGFGVTTPRTELTKQVVDFKRPTVTFGDIVIDTYNSKVKLIGKPEWGDSSVTFRDDAQGNVTRLIGEQLQKQFDFMEQSSASSGIDYKFITRLEMLDGGNGINEVIVLETWELYGCLLTSVDYQTVNYGTNDPVTIACTIKFDNAIQTPINSGVGATITRALGTVVTGAGGA
jgi:hypothetical protein